MIARLALVDRSGALQERLLSAANSLPEPPAELVVASAADLTAGDVDTDLLVLGPRELTRAGLARLAAFRAAHPGAAVVAVRGDGSPSTAQLAELGIEVVLGQSPSVATLRRVLLAADEARVLEVPPGTAVVAQAPADDAGQEPALIVTIASPTGGCGKTFFATNLTAHLVSAGLRPLLIDLDLQFGEVAAALQVKHPHSIYDGFYDAAGRPLPEAALPKHLGELVFAHPLGFDLLPAPRDPALADYLTAEDVERLLLVVADRYDVVVVDTPPSLNDVTLTVIDRSDVIGVMTTLDVPSLRNLTALLDVLQQLEVDEHRVRLLLNKVETDIGLDVKQAQAAFGGRFVATLPASKAASRSINTGTVVLRSEPRSPLARALVAAIEAVVPADVLRRGVDATSHGSPRNRLLSALTRHRSTAPGGTS